MGAAFLMATSAIGPGFLTQTAVFTSQLRANFGFIILATILLDIAAQLNIWRVVAVSSLRAQDIANTVLPGLGYVLAALIMLGGLAFNIGNIAGCGMGLNVLMGMNTETAALISCVIALGVFWMKEAGPVMDIFSKLLGILMILLTMYVAISSQPPVGEALMRAFAPAQFDAKAMITLVGGTVGGYISFAGVHRLLDAGIKGESYMRQVNNSAVSGIVITGIMRSILFLAALGVVAAGYNLDKDNPAAAVFKIAAGDIGYRFFGVVMWSAAITSVVGAAYTSVSFIRSFHPLIEKYQRYLISVVIVFSTVVFISVGKPVQLLVAAGALNGLILPLSLSVILLAAGNKKIIGNYRHPKWMQAAGWVVVAIMLWLSVATIVEWLG